MNDLGVKSTVSLLKKGADVDCIEEVLRVVFTSTKMPTNIPHETAEAEEEEQSSEPIFMSWLAKLCTLEKFDLMMQFANKQLIADINVFVSSQGAIPKTVRSKFSVAKS